MERTELNAVQVLLDTDIGRDPDDALALLWLLSRADVDLISVTVTPGDADQLALARFLLTECGHPNVPVGSDPERLALAKQSLMGCNKRLLEGHGVSAQGSPDGEAWQVMEAAWANHQGATLLTTGPLGNVGRFLRESGVEISRSVSMGGYWPEPGAPRSMPEFNFNGARRATALFLETDRIQRRLLVGKNVTHQVFYNKELHKRIGEVAADCQTFALMHELMCLRGRLGKKLHDPLAAVAAVDESVADWNEVLPARQDRGWTSVPCAGSGIWAATDVCLKVFYRYFIGECHASAREASPG